MLLKQDSGRYLRKPTSSTIQFTCFSSKMHLQLHTAAKVRQLGRCIGFSRQSYLSNSTFLCMFIQKQTTLYLTIFSSKYVQNYNLKGRGENNFPVMILSLQLFIIGHRKSSLLLEQPVSDPHMSLAEVFRDGAKNITQGYTAAAKNR